jgi:hypothetical protein
MADIIFALELIEHSMRISASHKSSNSPDFVVAFRKFSPLHHA